MAIGNAFSNLYYHEINLYIYHDIDVLGKRVYHCQRARRLWLRQLAFCQQAVCCRWASFRLCKLINDTLFVIFQFAVIDHQDVSLCSAGSAVSSDKFQDSFLVSNSLAFA